MPAPSDSHKLWTHFWGKGHPDTGLYYYGARWFDPERGRWVSEEPLGLDGPNLYQFVFSNSINFIDVFGLATISAIFFDSELENKGYIKPIPKGNRIWIRNVNDFNRMLAGLSPGDTVNIYGHGSVGFVTFGLDGSLNDLYPDDAGINRLNTNMSLIVNFYSCNMAMDIPETPHDEWMDFGRQWSKVFGNATVTGATGAVRYNNKFYGSWIRSMGKRRVYQPSVVVLTSFVAD